MPKPAAVRRSDKPDLESVRRDVDWHSSKQKGVCPLCHKRKLSVSEGRDVEVVVKCWGECDQDEVAAALGLSGRGYTKPLSKHESTSDQRYDRYCRLRDGLAIFNRACGFRGWQDCRPVYEPVDQPRAYFNSRGIDKCPPTARLLPASETRTLTSIRPDRRFRQPLLAKQAPHMVVPMLKGRRFRGVQTTALTLAGNGKLNDNARRSFGVKKGSYIPLDTVAIDSRKPTVVGEGTETTTSLMEILGYQGVAAIDAGNFSSVDLPTTGKIIHARDRGDAGHKAHDALVERYGTERVFDALPPEPFKDWNDAIKAAKRGELSLRDLRRLVRKAISKAPSPKRDEGQTRTVLTPMSEIEERPIKWFWKNMIAEGVLVTIYGDSDLGKSTMLIDLAARTTRGDPMPLCADGKKGSVIILTKEDALDAIVKPRLRAAGAVMSKIYTITIKGTGEDGFPPAVIDRLDKDVAELEGHIREIGDGLLLVIDGWTSFGGDLSGYGDAEVRKYLEPLANIAARYGITIIGNLHLNKKEDLTSAKARAIGGVGYINVPRMAFLVAIDPDNHERRILVQAANRLTGHRHQAVRFGFEPVRAERRDNVEFARIVWEDEMFTQDPDELLGRKVVKDPSKVEKAKQFLEECLADGPMPRDDIQQQAKWQGLSWATVRRAKNNLPIQHYQERRKTWWNLRFKAR